MDGFEWKLSGAPMQFDLALLAQRLQSAAGRLDGLTVEVSAADLIFAKDGHGTGRSESMPFAALFLRPDDVIGQALDRLDRSTGA